MIYSSLFFLLYWNIAFSAHFNGGTITWKPINPSINSTIVTVTITQTYYWTYPAITCANNVPITTPGRTTQNANLTCMSDCLTDGNYSRNPISILTDCQSFSSSLGLLTSERSVTINLTANAHFYLANVGAAWAPLNSPAVSGLQWSIVTFIDLRFRPDGFINTPPVASVVSPQYAIVNRTTQITIPVSDVNAGDDVRCRWSVYKAGSRRRKRFEDEIKPYVTNNSITTFYTEFSKDGEIIHVRKKRGGCKGSCTSTCAKNCACTCAMCKGTTCSGSKCSTGSGCPVLTTTAETPGTIKTTSSFPNYQAIDECGGICSPGTLPNGTTLSGCTITFKGLVPNTWYAVSLQVTRPTFNEFCLFIPFFSSFIGRRFHQQLKSHCIEFGASTTSYLCYG